MKHGMMCTAGSDSEGELEPETCLFRRLWGRMGVLPESQNPPCPPLLEYCQCWDESDRRKREINQRAPEIPHVTAASVRPCVTAKLP